MNQKENLDALKTKRSLIKIIRKFLALEECTKENERKINGIGTSLDVVKAEQKSMRSEMGVLRGLTNSANAGVSALAERLQNVATNNAADYTRVENALGELNKKFDGLSQSITKTMLKIVWVTIAIVAVVTSLFVYIVKAILNIH